MIEHGLNRLRIGVNGWAWLGRRQYSDIQNFSSKAHHTPFKDEASQSKIYAAYGLYNMATGKYKDAATSFAQVKPQAPFKRHRTMCALKTFFIFVPVAASESLALAQSPAFALRS